MRFLEVVEVSAAERRVIDKFLREIYDAAGGVENVIADVRGTRWKIPEWQPRDPAEPMPEYDDCSDFLNEAGLMYIEMRNRFTALRREIDELEDALVRYLPKPGYCKTVPVAAAAAAADGMPVTAADDADDGMPI